MRSEDGQRRGGTAVTLPLPYIFYPRFNNNLQVGSLFRGMMMPLMSRAIVNGMCFSTYTLMMKVMYPEGGSPLGAVFFAGGCAGAASALVASPTELIKVT